MIFGMICFMAVPSQLMSRKLSPAVARPARKRPAGGHSASMRKRWRSDGTDPRLAPHTRSAISSKPIEPVKWSASRVGHGDHEDFIETTEIDDRKRESSHEPTSNLMRARIVLQHRGTHWTQLYLGVCMLHLCEEIIGKAGLLILVPDCSSDGVAISRR